MTTLIIIHVNIKIIMVIDDLRKYLGQLVSLAFAIISDDSHLLKKAGFSLIIELVKLFRTAIEEMRD